MPQTKHTQGKGHHGHLRNGACPPELAIWKMMIQRCCNPRCAEFNRYGGRGIGVSDRWLAGFSNFLEDVGPQPFAGAGLRRLDPQGHFEPGNVEWGDTRTKHMLTHDGRTLSLAGWAAELVMKERTLRARLRDGWPVPRILNRFVANRDHLARYRSRKRSR